MVWWTQKENVFSAKGIYGELNKAGRRTDLATFLLPIVGDRVSKL